MRRPVHLLSALLCLALTPSGAAMSAQGHGPGPAIAGYAELCRDGSVVVVAVDDRGQPVGPAVPGPPRCPDCVPPAALVPPMAPIGAPSPVQVSRAAAPARDGATPTGARHARPHARAPPSLSA
ncbi:MAG: hypothetical protein MUF73_10965 [Rhodobacteraceae bacterium]|jgi:hypothetical protein|nr:hypothetical protein [Paracoccaceae bacterium]